MKRFGLLSLILVFALSACTTILSINENKIEIPSSGLSTDIQLDVNKDWTASSSADWCRINPSSGDKNTKVIHVNVLQSTLYDYRECEITIVCEDKTATVSVHQLQMDAIKLGTDLVVIGDGNSSGSTFSLTINEKEQTFTVGVSSNVEFDVTPKCDWIQLTTIKQSTKGLSGYSAVFHAEANDATDPRVGTISFCQKGGIVESIATITQEERKFISASTKTVDFEWKGATTTIPISSNVDFEVSVSEGSSWLNVERIGSSKDYSVKITADDYIPTPESVGAKPLADRSAVISLVYGNLKEEITVNQDFKDYIWLSATEKSAYVGYGDVLQFQPFFHDGINSTLSMSIDRPDIAQAYSGGVFIPKAIGQATLTVSNADNTYSANCALTVKSIADDIYVVAAGKSMTISGGYVTMIFHSNIHYPDQLKSIKYNSVLLCQPDGTVYDIQSTSNGYVQFNPIVIAGSYSSSMNDYYSTWFVVYQTEIDGEYHEYRTYLDANTWTGSL